MPQSAWLELRRASGRVLGITCHGILTAISVATLWDVKNGPEVTADNDNAAEVAKLVKEREDEDKVAEELSTDARG